MLDQQAFAQVKGTACESPPVNQLDRLPFYSGDRPIPARRFSVTLSHSYIYPPDFASL